MSDLAKERIEYFEAVAGVERIRQRKHAADYEGECEWCERQSKRIVNGACATCRDKYKLD